MFKRSYFLCVMSLFFIACQSTNKYLSKDLAGNEESKKFPYGKPDINANFPVDDYKKLIGVSKCKSLQYRGVNSGDTLDLIWRWKYVLNGRAVQDDAWYEGSNKSKSSYTSLRMYNPKTNMWNVSFFIPEVVGAQIWEGKKRGDSLVFDRSFSNKQNGPISKSRFIFSEITDNSYKWQGMNFNSMTNQYYIFWEIWCNKVKE